MTSTDEAQPKTRARKRTGTLTKQRSIRFGADEQEAIEAAQTALSKTTGRKVTFAEALRLLILDREEEARVRARAEAMGEQQAAGPSEDLTLAIAALVDELNGLRQHVGRLGGNINQIARHLNSGDQVARKEISDALAAVKSLQSMANSLEDAAYKSTRTSRYSR